MKSISGLICSLLLFGQAFSQNHNAYYQSLVDQVNKNNIIQYLNDLESFGEKTLGSDGEADALQWLISNYQSWGYDNIETHKVNAYGQTGYNLIVTKTGTVHPETFVIIDGHYDSINGPGTNDNGSGTSVILELARILVDVNTEYSIKFIHFTAEEWGLIGSQQYVDEIVVPENLDIKLVLNIDEIGGIAGMNNDTVVCERDESSPSYNNAASAQATVELANSIELYSVLNTTFDYAYGSDYVPFQEKGYVITGLYEFNESPYPHSPNDTLSNLDTEYIYQIAKGTLGALAFFSVAYDNLNTTDLNTKDIQIYPNPADDFIKISGVQSKNKIQLFDGLGAKVFEAKDRLEQDLIIDLRHLTNGIYTLKINELSYKIIVQHK